MKKDYYLYLAQDKKEYFSLPEGWKPLHFVETEEGTPPPPIEQMTREALARPTGSLPFRELNRRRKRLPSS